MPSILYRSPRAWTLVGLLSALAIIPFGGLGCTDVVEGGTPWTVAGSSDAAAGADGAGCERGDAIRYEKRHLRGLAQPEDEGDPENPIRLQGGEVWLRVETREHTVENGETVRSRVRLHRYRWSSDRRSAEPLPSFVDLERNDGYRETLVSGDAERRMIVSRVRRPAESASRYLWTDGPERRRLASGDVADGGPRYVSPVGPAEKLQWTNDPWAVWRAPCEGVAESGTCLRVANFDSGERWRIPLETDSVSNPAIGSGWVAWVDYRGSGEALELEHDGDRWTGWSNETSGIRGPVFADRRLYWVQNDRLTYISLDKLTDNQTIPTDTPAENCLDPVADGSRVAAACGEDRIPETIWTGADDGVSRTGLAAGTVVDVSVDDDRLAWLEFPNPDDGCEPGRVRVARLGSDPDATTVGRFDRDCSDLPRPTANVWLDGPYVAWTHADPPDSGTTAGLARIDWSTNCR